MQSQSKLQAITEKLLRKWYYNSPSYKYHCFYNPGSDEVFFFFADHQPPEGWIQVLSRDEMFWANRNEILDMDICYQRTFFTGMACELTNEILANVKQIKKNLRKAT